MAEALVVVSVVASIVQLVDFSTRVVAHLDEFYSVAKEVPESFRHVKTELPLLAITLAQLKDAINTTSVSGESTKALVPIIAGCAEQVKKLDGILTKILPEANDSMRTKGKKAIASLHYDPKVETITKTLRNYVGTLTFYYAAVSSTLQPLTDTKLCKIRQWLSAPDPSTNYQKALKLRQADTGLWLLESDAYTDWKTSVTSPLWLYGIPGCGKTILSSTVLQDVLQYCQDDPGRVTAYFFFDFNNAQKQDPEMMVRSLLCQLSQQSIKIPASLDTLFSSCENGQRQPSTDALMNALKLMTQEFPQIYIVLDALDECAQRVELMEMFGTIMGWKLTNLHLVVTSRREHDIESSLEEFLDDQNRICLQSAVVDKDIQRYVRQRLSTDKRLRKWEKDASTTRQIETVLMSGAKGMFRWAVCQLDELGKCVNRKMLQKALAGLPPDLDQTYERILGTIDGDYSPYALRILQWVAFSIRPLFIDEVAEVVAIDPKRDPAFDCDEVLEDPLEVLNICSSLVTMVVDQGSPRQVVELAHYSVKEYLVSDRICTGKAAMYSMREDTSHDSIAASCLGYLLQLPEPSLGLKFLRPCGLAGYSTPYWPSHVEKAGERSKGTTEAIIRLLDEKEVAYINWVILYEHRQPGPDHKDIPEPLYYAASFGLIDVVKLLLDKGANVNAQKGIDNNGSALYAASYRGHEATVKLLLDKGAMPPANCEDIYEPLHAASQNGHEAVVKLLLNKFADIYTTGECYSESLLEASFQGHEAIVKLLLDKGAVTGECYSKALYAASLEGSEATVKVLLDKSAIFPKRADCYGEALWVASYGGHEAVVKLLLDMCDIVPGTARYYDTALDTAANKHHEAVVKLLLDKGAVMPNACS